MYCSTGSVYLEKILKRQQILWTFTQNILYRKQRPPQKRPQSKFLYEMLKLTACAVQEISEINRIFR